MKTKVTTKNQKINKAARLGVRIDVWKFIAKISQKVNEKAVAKHNQRFTEQSILLEEIMRNDVEVVPTVNRFKHARQETRTRVI